MELKNSYQETGGISFIQDVFFTGTFAVVFAMHICLGAAQGVNRATSGRKEMPIEANIQSKPWEGELSEFGSSGYGFESLPLIEQALDPLESYIPKTELGRVLLEVRAKMKAAGKPFLSTDEIDELIGRDRSPH